MFRDADREKSWVMELLAKGTLLTSRPVAAQSSYRLQTPPT